LDALQMNHPAKLPLIIVAAAICGALLVLGVCMTVVASSQWKRAKAGGCGRVTVGMKWQD
jgi:hypothetical protein